MKAVVVLLACSLVAAPLRAQDAARGDAGEPGSDELPAVAPADSATQLGAAEREARLRHEAGVLARAQGRLEDALEDFRRAHALAPSPDRLLSVIELLDALRRDRELLDAYHAYVALAPEGDPRLPEIAARTAVLERTLAGDRSVPEAPERAPEPPAREHTVLDEPWFWGLVALAAAGLVAGVLFGTASPGVEAPIPGDNGVIVRTLVELP